MASDGGKWALAGYLYQIVGTLSITTRLSSLASRPSNDGDVLIALRDVDQLFVQAQHESGQEDALLRFRSLKLSEDDDLVLVQFKCSVTNRRIGGSELRKIIRKLDESAAELSAHGQNVTACVLITNREFTSGRSDRAEETWRAEQAQPRDYELRRILNYSVRDSVSELEQFARQYGAFEEEIEKGIRWLVGEVIVDTLDVEQDRSIDTGMLVQAFTGSRTARPLTVASVEKSRCQRLDRFGSRMVIEQWNGDLIERKVLERVDEAVRERALVGLYGPGGCGKSVLMWQLLRRLQAIGCCTVRHASNLQRSWVVDAVQAWRNLSRSNDTAEEAIERLQIANPGQRPILWLGLDGLDEGERSADRESHIREILQWFWERDCRRGSSSPVATLVVSCRNQEDLHEVWLNLPLPRFYSGELPLTVPIGDFTEDEILKAAQKKIPELYPRIRDSIHAGSRVQSALVERDHDTAVFGHPSPDTSSGPVNGRVLKSLEHPAMWLALLSLEPLDQRNAVQGKKQSVYDLAHQFIIWFHSKLRYRERERFQNLTESDLVQVLGAIVQHSSETAPYSRDSDWSKPAWQTGQVGEAEANDLYREALSAGLIIEDARHLWRWRHLIVRDYLAST